MAMRSNSKKRSRPESTEADLTDDLLVKILRRLPANSLCICRCVYRRWRGVISDPDHRRILPQTIADFFYMSHNPDRFPVVSRHFTSISGARRPFIFPSLSFLPWPNRHHLNIMDYCNGLLLCRCIKPVFPLTFEYVVCNPATEKWVVFAESTSSSINVQVVRLGFDPAVSSHFHVFEFEEDDDGYVKGVQIYLSKTRVWSQKDSGWSFELFGIRICVGSRSIFFKGMLHVVTSWDKVAAVDVEAKTECDSYTDDYHPYTLIDEAFIDLAQGQLYLATYIANDLSVWVLEDYGSDKWILKHSRSYQHIPNSGRGCSLVSICPEDTNVFLVVGDDKMLMSSKMDQRVYPVMHILGHYCLRPYLLYVPNFSESLANGH